jgi:hypothetical protein
MIEKGGVSQRKRTHTLGWPKDLTNFENEYFFVIRLTKTVPKKKKGADRWWLCRCKRCGTEKEIRQTFILSKHARSCGCLRFRSGQEHPCWQGTGELYLDQFTAIKASAIKRNLEFSVDAEFLWNLFLKQNRRCDLTGLPLSLIKKGRKRGSASLDRTNNEEGYTKTNVRWVHQTANLIKRTLSDEELLFWVSKIKTRLEEKGVQEKPLKT